MAQVLTWGRTPGWIPGSDHRAVALVARLTSIWAVGGIQIGTLLQLGIAAMITACLAYCAVLAERPQR